MRVKASPLERTARLKVLFVGSRNQCVDELEVCLAEQDIQSFSLEIIASDADTIPVLEKNGHDLYLIDFDTIGQSAHLKRFLLSNPAFPIAYLTRHQNLPQIRNGSPQFLLHSELTIRNLLKVYNTHHQTHLASQGVHDSINSERKYRDLVEASSDLIWAVDFQGCWTYVNRAVAQIYGYEPHEMLGKPFSNFLSPNLVQKDLQAFASILNGKPVQRYETCHVRKDGTEIILSFNAFPLSDGNGEIIGATGTARDVSERKKRELLLQQQKEEGQIIFDSVPALICFKDKSNKIVRINKPAAQLIGLSQSELEGRSAIDIFPNDAARFTEEDHQVISTGQPMLGIVEKLSLPSGQTRWLRTDKLPYRDESNNVAGVIVFSKDITDKLLAEERSTKLQKQLTQSQKMEAIGQLAAGIAHDLNNSLSAVVGHLELMKLHPSLDQELATSTAIALSGCERASSLIDQLLGFARQGRYNLEILSLKDSAVETTRFLSRVVGKDLHFIHQAGTADYFTMADATQLQQVLINLVLNADKAMPHGGTVTFSYGETFIDDPSSFNANAIKGEYVWLSVTDTGPGIDAAILDKIFEPFFTTKPESEGTGLGLAMVYGIMQAHGGWVEVESSPGKGSIFRLFFPKSVQTASSQQRPLSAQNVESKATILVIDDESALADLTRIFLERSGFTVHAFCKPSEATNWYRSNSSIVDLILLDMKMPEMDGEACFNQIREVNPKARVAVLSGYADDDVANRLLEKGVLKFHQKPLRYPDLVRWVQENTLPSSRFTNST